MGVGALPNRDVGEPLGKADPRHCPHLLGEFDVREVVEDGQPGIQIDVWCPLCDTGATETVLWEAVLC